MEINKNIVEMRKKRQSQQQKWAMILMVICGAIIGALSGGYGEVFLSSVSGDIPQPIAIVLYVVLTAIIIAISLMFHVYIHECGHMIFGRMTGYTFQSIRFGSFMFVKIDGKVKIKKYSLAGTGGQCLMLPPENSTDVPVVAYNLGGIFANLIFSAIFFMLIIILPLPMIVRIVFAYLILLGIGLAIINGIPLSSLSNDGYNAMCLRKDKDARQAFKISLMINDRITNGEHTKDMPREWFEYNEKRLDNNFTSSMAVSRLNYLVYCHNFIEAKELAANILENALFLANTHEIMVNAEFLYCSIMTADDKKSITEQFNSQLDKLKLLKSLPSTLRVMYSCYMYIGEAKKAEETKIAFENMAKKYPYPSEIIDERELMDIALTQINNNN